MEPISLLLLWLIGSIVLGVPEDTIVLVEDEDGKGRDFSAMLPRFEKRHRG